MEAMGVKQIEQAIAQLPTKELAELVSWLEDYHAQVWDKQIEDDLQDGRLDSLLEQVDKEYETVFDLYRPVFLKKTGLFLQPRPIPSPQCLL